jgi:hypothetical protein
MTTADIASLRVRKPLTDVDKVQLIAIQKENKLPDFLSELAEWMLDNGEKGEQEGYL